MKAIRQLLRDRVSVGMLAAILAAALLFQAALAGFSQGAMAAATADPLNVICHSGDDTSPLSHSSRTGELPIECPCGLMCQAASGMHGALPVGTDTRVGLTSTFLDVASAEPRDLALPFRRPLSSSPRAPPSHVKPLSI